MNVLYIGKYPPIQGGTSSAAYWRFDGLRKYGIRVVIVTCIPSDNPYQHDLENSHDVHILRNPISWHIPYSQLFTEQLVEKSLEVASSNPVDIVEGCYLFPYAVAAFFVAMILKKPLIIRHAGSDLFRVAQNGRFDSLLLRMGDYASAVVTTYEAVDKWRTLGISLSKLHICDRYYPNPSYFINSTKENVTVFMGKITPKWDRKQLIFWHRELLKNKFSGKIVSYSDKYTADIIGNFFRENGFYVKCHNFVEPKCVPQILSHCKFLLVSSIPKAIPEESNLVMEGISCGCNIISTDEITEVSVSESGYLKYILDQVSIYECISM